MKLKVSNRRVTNTWIFPSRSNAASCCARLFLNSSLLKIIDYSLHYSIDSYRFCAANEVSENVEALSRVVL